MELGGTNLLQRKFEGNCTKVINDYWHWKIMSKLFTSIMKVNNELKWIRTKEDKRSAIGRFKRDHEWMRFCGYCNDMFLVFLCNHVQWIYLWYGANSFGVNFIYYFMVTVPLKSMYVVYTRSADFILLDVSMVR